MSRIASSPLRHDCRRSQLSPIDEYDKSAPSHCSAHFQDPSWVPWSLQQPLLMRVFKSVRTCMMSDDGEQDLCKLYDSIANDNSNPRARRRSASGMIQSIPQRNMPQSQRNSCLDISPLRIYPVHLPSSPLQPRRSLQSSYLIDRLAPRRSTLLH